jgi:site-specific DNA recombinase
MNAVLYCRVSSEMQRESGTIQSQVDFARQYCQLQKIKILETYLDDGVSGTVKVADRPAGARLLADARARRFDTVLVFRIDRLARRTSDLLNTLELLEECGVAIRSMSEPFDTSSATGKFMTSMLGSIAELERSNIASRSLSGMERKVREGSWVGGRAPFGYRVVDGKLAVDPEQGPIVKDIFTWYLCGQRVRGITARLNAAGIKHPMDWNKPTSRPWYEASVSGLLHNRSYVGEWEWRKRTDRKKVRGKTTFKVTPPEQRIAVAIPVLVSREDFDRVQQTLSDNFVFSKRNVKHFYLLRGLIFCGSCGRPYGGVMSGRKPWLKNYYRCGSHNSAAGSVPCDGKAIRADLLDAAVWDQCVEFITHPESVFDELRLTMESRQSSQHELKDEVSQMDSALSAKAKERARVISLIRRAFISDSEGERELATLQREVEQIGRQRAELLSRLAASESSELKALTAETMLGLLADKVPNIKDETKREIALVLVDQIVIEKVYNKPLAKVCYVFRSVAPPPDTVNSVEFGLATSSARFTESWPRTSRKSTL